ncbi:methyl-accepting chemotaxis protein [Sporosarcina sp. Sa2YVA2]|uniref:Methyl-accepting chemotaxis protein n=1 Tax=Sporosarcina quadrami TaxID=2762234 RepID=A0ABR8UB17_9BACL|nr:methyl-accepting chemotaxis protein [Sporosarcina quadrami]MBD7985201.1 methyl-accepting chemotaxis protein [Sporosarcina quadrami]
MRWTVGKKLTGIFSIMIILIIGMSAAGIVSTFNLNENTKTMTDKIVPKIDHITKLEKSMQNITNQMQRHILSKDREFELKYEEDIVKENEKVEQLLVSYTGLLTMQNERDILESVKADWQLFMDKVQDVISLSGSNRDDEAIIESYDTTLIATDITEQLENMDALHNDELVQIEEEGGLLYNSVLIILSVSTLIALLIAIIGIRYLLRTIQRPIVSLSDSFKKMSTGDLSIEPINVKTNDEIGQLGHDFNMMQSNLKGLMEELSENVNTLASTSMEFAASADESSHASEQITNSVIDVSESASLQLESARRSSELVDTITDQLGDTALAIHQVTELSVTTADLTSDGTKRMATAVQKMTDIEQSTEHTATVVQSLHKKSSEIGNIVSLITNIAGQTNLLALNASIEAARAGEHGKGFAVVASEVGKLAQDSGNAAAHIRKLIEEVQHEVGSAIEAMQTSKEFVDEGLTIVQQTGEGFKEISYYVEQVSTQVREVSTISEAINTSIEQVKQLVDEVANMSGRTDDNVQNIVAASEEQSATMQEISASSTVLSGMADTLQTMVSKFKLK